MLAGIQPRRVGKAGALEPELDGLFVHPLDERRRAAMRHARERPGRGVVGGDQREVQHVVERDALVGAEIGRRCRVDVAPLDGDFPRQVRVVFEEDQRGHHLRDAGDRSLVLRVLFPEHLAGFRIENDGGRGADIRDQGAVRVGLEPGAHRLLERREPGLLPGAGRRASAGEPCFACAGGRGGVGRLARRCRGFLAGGGSAFEATTAQTHRRRAAARAVELRSEGGSNARILRYDSGWLGFNRCSEYGTNTV